MYVWHFVFLLASCFGAPLRENRAQHTAALCLAGRPTSRCAAAGPPVLHGEQSGPRRVFPATRVPAGGAAAPATPGAAPAVRAQPRLRSWQRAAGGVVRHGQPASPSAPH
ncbi:MAG: hypothetical protein J3K34DRAFT_437530 [Monoraphidium minutum]|nr:MAG: hypothetical protein J3K34DRAFT_437530 [Monoraphidium minutum]